MQIGQKMAYIYSRYVFTVYWATLGVALFAFSIFDFRFSIGCGTDGHERVSGYMGEKRDGVLD